MIKVFKREEQLGLAEFVQANRTNASACLLPEGMEIATFEKDKAEAAKMRSDDEVRYMKKYIPSDSMDFKAILVTANWNKNDDVFTPDDTFLAHATPTFKPINMSHSGREGMENKIFGVIHSSLPVDEKYHFVYESYDDENDDFKIPEDFEHILVGGYLWEKYFPTFTNAVKEGIENGDLFVSMECIFNDFGYALKSDDSEEVSLLERTEATSWLTQHLRVAGGKGEVRLNGKKYRVGRWLRDFVFSGMGFVPRPGNDKSIIFEDYISHANEKFNHVGEDDKYKESDENFTKSQENCVLNNNKGNISLWLN